MSDPERLQGLGVAIAQEIAKAYRGELKFRPSGSGGLEVQVCLT